MLFVVFSLKKSLKEICHVHYIDIDFRMMLPYAHTTEEPAGYDELLQIGQAGQSAIAERYGSVYRLGTIANIICEDMIV